MAHFAKFANLSLRGWDAKTATQTISIGENAHIGLFGGDPKGNDLDVRCGDQTICVVHEEPHPRLYKGWRHFLITALRDGETMIAAFIPGSFIPFSLPMTVKVVGHAGVRMVFFPGERLVGSTTLGTIYVIGSKGESIAAAAGEPVRRADRGGHIAEPTPPGFYTLGPKIHVTTTSWPKSVIPWGANLRINGDGEVEFEGAAGRWIVATGSKGAVTAAAMAFVRRDGNPRPNVAVVMKIVRDIFIDPKTGKLRDSTYKSNDFGVWGWNLRSNRQPTPYFIHTTPESENTGAALANSHGCIHLNPKERDRLDAAGVLRQGASFEVRPYTEVGPP